MEAPVSTPKKHPGGRPTKYSRAIAAEICRTLATSDCCINEICERVGIEPSTFFLWRHKHPEFSEQVARAMQLHYETLGESLLDYSERDVIAGDRSDSARVQLHRVRIETRRWLLERRLPSDYGNRLQLDADIEFTIPDIRPIEVTEATSGPEIPGPKTALPEGTAKRVALPPRGLSEA